MCFVLGEDFIINDIFMMVVYVIIVNKFMQGEYMFLRCLEVVLGWF